MKNVYQTDEFGEVKKVVLKYGKYRVGGTLSVSLYYQSYNNDGENGSLYSVLTVNFPESQWLPENAQFVDINNNVDIESWLLKNGIAKPLGIYHLSGYCKYPAYQFFPDKTSDN